MPDLGLPPGTVETSAEVRDPGALALPIGEFTPEAAPTRTIEGRLTRRIWRVPSERGDTLALARALRAQLADAGFVIDFDCETDACGGFDFRFSTEVAEPPAMEFSLADFRQVSATRPEDGTAAALLISRTPRGTFIQAVFVEPANTGLPQDLTPPTRDAEAVSTVSTPLAEQLDKDGRAVLEGIGFASGSATLAPELGEFIAPLAALLADRPDLRIAIVGHTDTDGSLEGNVAISRARAQAVAAALISEFGIEASRIEAHGAGYLAPRTSNATEEGRAENRRVEIVVR